MPDEQRAVKAEFLAEFQTVADEVRRQHRRLRVKPDKIADVVRAVVAGRKEDVQKLIWKEVVYRFSDSSGTSYW